MFTIVIVVLLLVVIIVGGLITVGSHYGTVERHSLNADRSLINIAPPLDSEPRRD